MFEFLNPFRRIQERKRARIAAEKTIAARKAEREAAETEAKRRQEYAAHLEELKAAVKQPNVRVVSIRESDGYSTPKYSSPEEVTNLLNTISEQSRVTSFEFGSTNTGSNCSGDSGSSSDSGSSCGSSD